MRAPTQDHLPIEDIHDDVVILKDGSVAVVIQTSAVNFGLLSEQEQLAIISSFAAMLNSLSFMIQIVISSKRLDISSYLAQLDQAKAKQSNPLLSAMISRYRDFIRSTIQENEVLDKRFYIVIPVSYLETGAITKSSNDLKKIMAILGPRRDQIMRQLARIGLKSNQLITEELIRLFYDIYNGQSPIIPIQATAQQPSAAAQQAQPKAVPPAPAGPSTSDAEIIKTEDKIDSMVLRAPQPTPQQPVTPQAAASPPLLKPTSPQVQMPPQSSAVRRRPYIVEELPEDYGTT